MTMGVEFGDVVLVPFPFTSHAASRRPPAVVVPAWQGQDEDGAARGNPIGWAAKADRTRMHIAH
jgi:hypothetical protein